jgi:hypothetical protein
MAWGLNASTRISVAVEVAWGLAMVSGYSLLKLHWWL